MKKIISLFKRNYDGDYLVRDEVVPGAEWVLQGEGTPTRKYDGTCCMVLGGQLYKRYELPLEKKWEKKRKYEKFKGPWFKEMFQKPPVGWVPAEETPDESSGSWPGWVPVGDGPEDKYHREAFVYGAPDGTYELVGPKVQGNQEGFHVHTLVRHGADIMPPATPRTFMALRNYFQISNIEGIVWHHPDGRMVKIKAKDFGIKRKQNGQAN